jgi:hypothetical protein
VGKVTRIGSAGELIDLLVSKYEKGEIEGLIVCLAVKDGCFEMGWTEGLSYLKRLGLLEAAKADCHYQAMCAFCQ